jgi:dihydroflavonol-4-reductase
MAYDNTRSTVLVTGGSGYLAGWVILGLLERGYDVKTTMRSPTKAPQLLEHVNRFHGKEAANSLSVVTADLLTDDGWDAAFDGVDFVLHTASPMPFDTGADFIRTAREGTRRVLGAAARAHVQRAVLTSSGVTAVPEDPETAATEADRSHVSDGAKHVYPNSKILAEQDAWEIATATGMELTAVLPTFMQGPPFGRPATPKWQATCPTKHWLERRRCPRHRPIAHPRNGKSCRGWGTLPWLGNVPLVQGYRSNSARWPSQRRR